MEEKDVLNAKLHELFHKVNSDLWKLEIYVLQARTITNVTGADASKLLSKALISKNAIISHLVDIKALLEDSDVFRGNAK